MYIINKFFEIEIITHYSRLIIHHRNNNLTDTHTHIYISLYRWQMSSSANIVMYKQWDDNVLDKVIRAAHVSHSCICRSAGQTRFTRSS